MDNFEDELKVSFLDEAEQLLSEVEKSYLDLEANPHDSSILDQIFRVAHNLKGSAKAVGFNDVGLFSHHFENLLLKMKNNEVETNGAIISLLLKCNDHLCHMIADLKKSLDATFDSTELLLKIDEALEGRLGSESADGPVPSADQFEDNFVEETEIPSNVTSLFQESNDSNNEMKSLEKEEDVETHFNPVNEISVFQAPSPTPIPTAAAKPVKVQAAKQNASSEESIRVSLSRLEKLLNYVGEMSILQAVLKEQAESSGDLLKKTVHQLGKVTKEVQDISMSLRMVPLKATFQKMTRIVRDTSMSLGKQVTLEISGEDTELDKTILESVSDPLVHLIRNACDHGIESVEKRLENKKNPQGTISLSATHQNGKLVIEVKDDGGGINTDVLRKKAIEKKIISANSVISESDAINLIFHPGFSTKAIVTDVSGRGVGMDVVKTNIESIQGEVLVETVLGKGTTFKIILPLTLAIIDAIVVRESDGRYVIPLSHVHESVSISNKDIQFTTGLGEVLLLRGSTIPLFRLNHLLGKRNSNSNNNQMIAVVANTEIESFAVLVDDIIGQYQVVIKELGNELKNIRGFSGISILGDGKPALILELAELVSRNKVPSTQNHKMVSL